MRLELQSCSCCGHPCLEKASGGSDCISWLALNKGKSGVRRAASQAGLWKHRREGTTSRCLGSTWIRSRRGHTQGPPAPARRGPGSPARPRGRRRLGHRIGLRAESRLRARSPSPQAGRDHYLRCPGLSCWTQSSAGCARVPRLLSRWCQSDGRTGSHWDSVRDLQRSRRTDT
jgi:hypothetical protein